MHIKNFKNLRSVEMRKHRFLLVVTIALFFLGSLSTAWGGDLTRGNWTSKVGFRPNLENLPFAVGDEVNAGNVDKAGDMLPPSIKMMIKNKNLKFEVAKYKPVIPSDGYISATNKYLGKSTIINTGAKSRSRGITGYTAGLPVLKPKNGLDVAWNYHYSYNGDDADNHFGVYWISGKKGVEKSEEWTWKYIMRGANRTDIAPMPSFKEWEGEDKQYASLTVTLAPFDKKGFSALYYRFNDPKDQEGWIYLPQQRRTTRFSFGTRGDAWNNTDMLYEDVRGYMGYPEWMHWKIIGKKTMYAPMHSGTKIGKNAFKQTWDFETAPHWNPYLKWEPRAMYVVEVTPKFPDYPYKKMICYIDADSFLMMFKECYDKKGQLWKVIMNFTNDSKNPRTQPLQLAGALAVDLQGDHATTFCWYNCRMNVGLTTKDFSPTTLRKIGK